MVFITEEECVYCAVRAESLNIVHVDLSLFSAETRVPSQDTHCKTGGKVLPGQVFLRVRQFFSCQHLSTKATHVFSYMLVLPEGQMSEAWKPSRKERSFENSGTLARKVLTVSLQGVC
jgi:hypothetical protein